jgi:octaprenyl-diphosphate synthase
MTSKVETVLEDPIVDKIQHLNKEVIESVNKLLDQHLNSEDLMNVQDLVNYQHRTGGKRLRPLLCVMIGTALGGNYEDIIGVAAIPELIHTSSLIFDDVVDWDAERRGKPTTHAVFGVGSSVMGGVTVAVESMEASSPHGMEFIKLTLWAMRRLTVGNAEELLRIRQLDEDQYMHVIDFKTAALFEAACKFGAMAAGATSQQIDDAAEYGRCVGQMYQLCDDIVDVEKSIKLGKAIGDIQNGVITLPLIYTYRMTERDAMRKEIRKFIKSSTRDEADASVILKEMERLDATGYARDEVEDLSDRARYVISKWPWNNHTEMLEKMPEFMAESILAEIDNTTEDGKE